MHTVNTRRLVCLLAALAGLVTCYGLTGNSADSKLIVIKLVTDFESGRPVSDLEEFQPVTTTVFDAQGSHEVTLGEKAVLWVRNAHIDRKFFFERYYQEKYVGRRAVLEIDPAELGAGEHVLQPGGHKFTLAADGTLASDDPDIRVQGSTLLVRLYPVTIYAVDGARTGPPQFRVKPADIGVLGLDAGVRLDPTALPDPKLLDDPRLPAAKRPPHRPAPVLTNVLSHQKAFYPLTVWLPANQVGQGYVLYPSWQAFHLSSGGKIDLGAAGAPKVPGVEADTNWIAIPHRTLAGRLSTHSRLTAGVGATHLKEKMDFGATLAPITFRAGYKDTPEEFFLRVDNDLTRTPHKLFVADNTTADKDAIRLMALEWQRPAFAAGEEAAVALRVLEAPGKTTLQRPEARVSWSSYRPSNPLARIWEPLKVVAWTNGRDKGELRFIAPRIEPGFVVFRVEVFDAATPEQDSPLGGEIPACVLQPGQTGSASFVTAKGRNAFVAGEDVPLSLVFRSQQARPAGTRQVVLTHPDGHQETLDVADPGDAWSVHDLRLPAARSVSLAPGRYKLSVAGLPTGIAAIAMEFDLVGRQKPTLFHVVKTSKYTRPMNDLERCHLQGEPVDLDRAMDTLADLGFTRVDLMSYMTNHHLRAYTWREELAAEDDRLPPPEGVFTPSPRDQILNACVRNQLQYSDVWLSYGDFHLPRQIEPYILASERWMAREIQAMRHSPAMDGMMLYDEMYQAAVVAIVKHHPALFGKIRGQLAEKELGQTPGKIEEAFNRYLSRPASQRDPKVLEMYLKYQDWQQRSWADYVNRMVKVGKHLAPRARFGTYYRTWMSPGDNDPIYHGYPPDLFANLDIISHVHYADNSTCWVSIPMLAQILRTGTGKTLYVNMPLAHEGRTQWDGQYQRHMAFAMLAQGANGIAQWGTPHAFDDGPNPGTAQARDTTGPMNREILGPLGEIVDRTRDGYRKIGVVSTLNQHALSTNKNVPTGSQTEGIWIACWRLGYPAVFVREEHLRQKLEGFAVLFVPNVRFDGELEEFAVRRLREAIAAGTKVVVEADSTLDLPGIIKLKDWALNSYFIGGNYFPTWLDDELNKVYEKSQPIVDYLGPKLKEWGVEPAASGPFKVGPCWRDGGQAQYLIMANFEDPDYRHAVRQQMAKPVLMPLTIPAYRGRVAYDLLAQRELDLKPAGEGQSSLTLDMRRIQGAMVALLPERIGKLVVQHATAAGPDRLHLRASLVGVSGKPLDAVFPVRITLGEGTQARTFHRVLGRDLAAEFDLPCGPSPRTLKIQVRETLSGCTASLEVGCSVLRGPSLVLEPPDVPAVPRKAEVLAFLAALKKVVIVPSPALPGVHQQAAALAEQLRAHGIEARVADEDKVYRTPSGDPQSEDPLGDGFHSWHGRQETIGPGLVVDEPVILVAGRQSSFLLDTLIEHGILSDPPLGSPGKRVRPSIQLATKAFHYAHDTLCLVANDAPAVQHGVQWIVGQLKDAGRGAAGAAAERAATVDSAPPQTRAAAGEQTVESAKRTAITPATGFMGTNELVYDLQFDKAGNLYAITWGHGKNLYSLSPDGKPRFSRHLPEMGTNRLNVCEDRLLAYTSAGARVYVLGLDNKPLAQARLNAIPGPVNRCDSFDLSHADYLYLPGQRRLLNNLGERMRVLDEQFNIVAEWKGEAYRDKDVSDEDLHRELHGYAVSPDGQRIAQLETSMYYTKVSYLDEIVYDTHVVIRDLRGKLLYEYKNLDNGKEVEARIDWPAGAPGPVAVVKQMRWAWDGELKVLSKAPREDVLFELGGDRCLVRTDRTLVYQDRFGHNQCRLGPFAIIPTWAAISGDGARIALLDEYGLLWLCGTSDGRPRAKFMLPERGRALRFTPDNTRLVVGTFRGTILAYDLDGKLQWNASLAEQNDVLGQDLALLDPAFPDFTEKLWPVIRDTPGDLEKLVRLDADRLTNGDMESAGGWQVHEGAPTFRNEGHQSARSLEVGQALVGQEVTDYLGQHSTWVLEFFYRRGKGDAPTLLAGLMAESEHPDSVARRLPAETDWRFARVVIKSGNRCRRIAAGFVAGDGTVLVDHVRLRRIRFPSINHLQYEPFHAVKPMVLENRLFEARYNPFGALKQQVPCPVMLPNTANGSTPKIDAGFFQNGRLNDITSGWYVQPYSREDNLIISCGLKEPRWISMVALYCNAYDADNVLPHVDVLATDLEAKRDRLVAAVRHNGQLFHLVKFPPVKTSLVKLRLPYSIARLRTLTEIELYGPLSGREGVPGFEDPQGENTYMANFTRVDKRVKRLAESYQKPLVVQGRRHGHSPDLWFAPMAHMLVAGDRCHVARLFGQLTGHPLDQPAEEAYSVRSANLGFTPYGTLYGGLLLRPGNDGKLYCFNPETGTEVWSVKLGERLFGCPVAVGEDVFLASDAKKLYQIDLASGGILKETPISGIVYGSPATDGKHLLVITDDGWLHNYRTTGLSPLWKTPVAECTDSTPAVDNGVVYLGDQKGTARAMSLADGKVLWETGLGDEFCRCPVVGPDKVVFGCRGGKLAVLARGDGKLLWSKKVESRFEYEPVLLDDRLLYFQGKQVAMARLADGNETLWEISDPNNPIAQPEPVKLHEFPAVPISYYRGNLFFTGRAGDVWHQKLEVNMLWHPGGGSFVVLRPTPPPTPPAEKEKP